MASDTWSVRAISANDLLFRHIVHSLHFWRVFNSPIASRADGAPGVGTGRALETPFPEDCCRGTAFRFFAEAVLSSSPSSSSIIITSWFSLRLVPLAEIYRFVNKMDNFCCPWRFMPFPSRSFCARRDRLVGVKVTSTAFVHKTEVSQTFQNLRTKWE